MITTGPNDGSRQISEESRPLRQPPTAAVPKSRAMRYAPTRVVRIGPVGGFSSYVKVSGVRLMTLALCLW